jgi:hypothetical protein
LQSAAAWLVTFVLLVAPIAGCGGGSSSTSTTTQAEGASAERQSADAKRLPGHPKIEIKPGHHRGSPQSAGKRYGSFTRESAAAAERRAGRRQRAAHRKLARKAGRAAPFLVAEGDNSIPTYGSEASAGMRREAESALSGYLQAREAENWPAACAAMSPRLAKQLALLAGQSGSPDCPKAYGALAERGSVAERTDPMVGGITSLRVEVPHAFALFYGAGMQQYMMPLEAEGGWKVALIAPVPWPVGTSPGG